MLFRSRRRLHRLGAVPLKSSVYVLPESDENLEDFQWLANEIISDGGEATIVSGALLSGVTDAELESLFRVEPSMNQSPGSISVPRGTTWVTRQGVFIDRIACAWLIRRFIDPDAELTFVHARGYKPKPGEVRFDMYTGEFTHAGDRCTFETLVAHFELDDPALGAIGLGIGRASCRERV